MNLLGPVEPLSGYGDKQPEVWPQKTQKLPTEYTEHTEGEGGDRDRTERGFGQKGVAPLE